jgi:phage terminase large subunit-like protein
LKPTWSTACPDWEQRIVEGRSLIPFSPLFPSEAEAALQIFDNLPVASIAGVPLYGDIARDWLREIVAALFGSYDADRGRRLIQYYMLLVAKKNDKSGMAAGVMTTALLRNWRQSGEFMIIAPSKQVADNSFSPVLDMIRNSNRLHKLLHPKENQRIVLHRETNATLKVVAADTEAVAGGKKIGVLVEEVWEFGSRANAERMFREAFGGLAARPEGFVFQITTQSDTPPKGYFDAQLKKFRDIRDGKIVDNNSLPILFEYPAKMIKEKAYLDPRTYYIPNPNLGASVDEESLLYDFEEAKRGGPATLADFLAKRLNVEIGIGLRSDGWAGALVWLDGADPTLTLNTLIERSEVIVASVDGGGLDDLLGLCVMGREKNTKCWLVWNRAYISPLGRERRKANATSYEKFAKAGDLVFVEKLPDDVTAFIEVVQKCKDSGLLHSVGADPAGLGIMVDALEAIDVSVEKENLSAVKQGVALMGAIKTTERRLADGTLKHSNQDLMVWCAGNAIVQPTSTGMRIVRDESGFGKIDPLMALFNCAAMMSTNPEPKRTVYEDRGLRVA